MVEIKQEVPDGFSNNHNATRRRSSPGPASVIDLSSSDSDEDDPSDARQRPTKKTRVELLQGNVPLPVGFLDPLPFTEAPVSTPAPLAMQVPGEATVVFPARTALRTEGSSKQFWKAGDFEDTPSGDWQSYAGGMDHVRVHPRFLHSNATSHKWVLGAFAELLDNALDEVRNGATFASIDMLKNKKDGSRILLIEDNGGGMDPDKMRQCMSLGYSAKSKIADTIGQYGNGFKTSTMRLGADVLVFSRSYDKDVNRSTQSIGLLSYTFLKETGKEDIVVPMLDYQRQDQQWKAIMRSSASDWENNVDTIIQWSPFSSEVDLLDQFSKIKDHGTRIFIYNLWEDDQGLLELDFDTDPHDIQIRGANRDEKHIQMAQEYPNSRHFLTYRHSLRSYASILYLRVPPSFRIILRGEDVKHHNIVNDMMMTQNVTYRPQSGTDVPHRDTNMVAIVTVGFVKDAKAHIDVQGFNVYHKNRLIKPFWRVWHPPGSDGRGVIGVLEANFVEPAHDKQGFERTIVLQRLESKLIQMQKTYWTNYCHKIGYAPRRNKSSMERERENSPDNHFQPPHKSSKGNDSNGKTAQKETKSSSRSKSGQRNEKERMEHLNSRSRTPGRRLGYSEESSQSDEDVSDYDAGPSRRSNGKDGSSTKPTRHKEKGKYGSEEGGKSVGMTTNAENGEIGKGSSQLLKQLAEENHVLKERLRRKEKEFLGDLLKDLDQERTNCKTLEAELLVAKKKIEELNEEQENLIDLFSEERQRHETEEENLRKKLKDASNTIQDLVDKVGRMGKMKSPSSGKAK